MGCKPKALESRGFGFAAVKGELLFFKNSKSRIKRLSTEKCCRGKGLECAVPLATDDCVTRLQLFNERDEERQQREYSRAGRSSVGDQRQSLADACKAWASKL
jgi:hypothetical protein